MWTRIARWLANSPRVVDWLIGSAMKHPYLHITDAATGAVYMRRWWLVPGGPAGDQAPRWLAWLPLAIRVHHIVRPDGDRHLHDHPFDFRSIILRGWYIEQQADGWLHAWLAGDTYLARADRFHRIDEVHPLGVWTLVILGKRKADDWGFMVDGKKVGWKKYLGVDQ